MNIYSIIILTTLVLSYGLELIADLLNLKSLRAEVPEELKGLYDDEAYRKSQEYTRTRTRWGQVSGTFDLLVLLLFWFLGGFNYLDHWVGRLGCGVIVSGLVYIGVLLFLNMLLSLPFDIHDTFVIEERFGFNKTTPATFVLDLVKSIGLTIVLGGPLLAGILAFFLYAGSLAWLWAWAAASLFLLFIHYIFPTWIMPLFNKFAPLPEGELRTGIFNYAQSVKFSLENVFVMDGSKRSSKGNAFFSGFGRHKRIALFDTLIAKHTAQEMVSVLAHEIGHYKKKHILLNMAISILNSGVVFFLLSLFLSQAGLYAAFYMDKVPLYAGFIFFGLLYAPLELILSLFINMLSRHNEFEADKFAAQTAPPAEVLVECLKKLSRDNLSNLTPHPFYVFVHYNHPPLLERIKATKSNG